MPSTTLHYNSSSSWTSPSLTKPSKSLPQLLQTPSGLALLEIQGTLHTPSVDQSSRSEDVEEGHQVPIGRLVFPLYDPSSSGNAAWMKRVYLYIGKHQRMTGEVKALQKPIAIIRKRELHSSANGDPSTCGDGHGIDEQQQQQQQRDEDDLEIVEIVKYKLLFASRPEPVSE